MLGKRISKKTLLTELAEVKSKLAELEFQQKIRDQEDKELYFRIFNKQKAIILLIDPGSGLIVDASSSAAEFYGYDLTEIKNLNIEDLNILTLKEIVNEINQAKSQNRNYFYFKHKLASGTIRDVEVRSVTVKVNGRKLLYFIVFDITDRLRLEARLKESEKDFQILSENIKEVFWFKTNDNISYVSSGYEKIWGKTPDSLYLNPNSFAECVYKKDKERILKVFNSEKYKTEGYFNEEYRIFRPDGVYKMGKDENFYH